MAAKDDDKLSPPPWPKSPKDGTGYTALANWVQDQLPEATEQWRYKVFGFDPELFDPSATEEQGWMRKSEKDALLDAIDKRGKDEDRWGGVAKLLRSGKTSPRFQAVVAHLIDWGGFHSQALAGQAGKYKAVGIYREKKVIEKILSGTIRTSRRSWLRTWRSPSLTILKEDFVPAPDRAAADLALIRSEQADEVRAALKLGGDKRRQALVLIRMCVAGEPTIG